MGRINVRRRSQNNYGGGGNRQRGFNRPSESRGRMNSEHIDAGKFVKAAQVIVATDAYVPTHKFTDFALSPTIQRNVLQKGYTDPTPIQDGAIQPILEGRDLIGIANTGTGKTAAFLLPLIQKVEKDKNFQKVLIVAPTRELAVQIHQELKDFAQGMGIYSVLVVGGASMDRQRQELRRGFHFLIGTPGRIKDLSRGRGLRLSDFQTVVLDEADRMVDIGFIHDIEYFISCLPKNRQSLFFSATVSGKVAGILNAFVTNPVTVSVKTQDTSENIEQNVVKVGNKAEKIEKLHDLLIQKEFEKVLIFGRTKWGVQKLADELVARGFRAVAIHGNKNQNQRQRALNMFKNNDVTILLATDVASRGIDIPDVTHVINYDKPATYDDYVHRIGRTGRAGKTGTALTFVD
ncbi:MAG: DEAD/DEAH box helicase [Candidatus Levybacteria bacterium]|nr:DEAD/DEAH box helicase [Candidatus Levybacteria bacterium]